jgi:hypothetical protein
MSKKTPVTSYASEARSELKQLSFVCSQLDAEIRGHESKFAARNRKHPDIPPVTNAPFNKAASRLLGIFQLCRSVDIYNWYCREALKLGLSNSPQKLIKLLGKNTKGIAETVARAKKKQMDVADEIIRDFFGDRYKGDATMRKAIHLDLDVHQFPETELLCTCRNILVHRRGHDEFGEIKAAIKKLGNRRAIVGAMTYPLGHMPIMLDSGDYLAVDANVGNWAVELLRQQIFLMDQVLGHQYKLPRQVWPTEDLSRKFLGPS